MEYIRVVGTALDNAGKLEEHLWRSAQPQGSYSFLPGLGIGKVLCLRSGEPLTYPTVKVFHLPLQAFMPVEQRDFQAALDFLRADWPGYESGFLIHCLQGHDRTGVICAAYRCLVQGWTLNEALQEMEDYGFNPLWFPLKNSLIEFVRTTEEWSS